MSADDNPKWKYAHGAMWLMIWLGFGGCVFLAKRKSDTPIIEIVIKQP